MRHMYSVDSVSFAYLNRFPALKSVSLQIPALRRVALIGANGSGKSTLLRLLDALSFPQSGMIRFDGHELSEKQFEDETFAHQFRQRVGFVFQDPEAQLFSPTVWDEICFGPLQMGWSRNVIEERVEQMLQEFGLSKLRDRPPHRLSIGEKKKVALASILVLEPEVLLLDEPTASLDPRTQSLLLELLHQWGHGKKTIVASTHDLSILREICDEVFVLQDGELVHHDTPENVLSNTLLLERTNLIHVHTHRHREVEHVHPHTHDYHAHEHDKGETEIRRNGETEKDRR